METFKESGMDKSWWKQYGHLCFSTFDEQDAYIANEQYKYEILDSVQSHFRCAGGEVPQRDPNQDHYVYVVHGEKDQLVYVGSGRGDRHKHADSGTSHNYKLNEMHFSKQHLETQIFASGLTKLQSEVLEKTLIGYFNPEANSQHKTFMYRKYKAISPCEAGWKIPFDDMLT